MAGHRFIIVACMLVLLASSFLSSSMSAQASSYPERILQRRLNAVKRAAQAGIRPGSEEASKEYVKQLFTDYLNKKKGELPPNPFANTTDLFTVIPGRYPKTVSLPEVLAKIPDGPEGRKFVSNMADFLYKRFGVYVPDFVVDMFFEDSVILLDFLQFTTLELYVGAELLNLAYQAGEISYTPPHVDYLPSGFDFVNTQSFPLNLSNYIPPPPTPIAPGLWQGFYQGKAPLTTIKSEVVLSLAFNQLSNNSHLPNNHPNRFSVVYNNQSYSSLDAFLHALLANNHSINIYLTWRAVDFFGWLTKDEQGEWREVPVPVMMDTGVYDQSDNQAVIPAIHDELVIEIRSGPNSKGFKFDVNLLWYEGDSGIGFFAGDLYSYATWVGTVNAEPLSGADAIRYIHMAGVFADTLLQATEQFNLYDLGYGATGICVDSVAVIEFVFFNEVTLWPLLMQKNYVLPVLKQNYALNNRDATYYADLLKGIDIIWPDIYGQPDIKTRAYNTITWPPGKEPFSTVIQGRAILQS